MTYVIVTDNQTIIGKPFASYMAAFNQAILQFGDDAAEWIKLNLRIEENR